jgi:hypothetical protein
MEEKVLVSYRLLPHHYPFAHIDTTTSVDEMSLMALRAT